MQNVWDATAGWTFLQEPAWRWGIFFLMMLFFMAAWGGVLRHM
jgi:hypothetical protein